MSALQNLLNPAQLVQSKIYYPTGTVRCDGAPVFRSQFARDNACLLDLDEDVVSWSCMAVQLRHGEEMHRPDFTVERSGHPILIDVHSARMDTALPGWIADVAGLSGYSYEVVDPQCFPQIRLRNAKDLLRYARFNVALSDRIRLLAALDEYSSLTVAECLTIFHETKPIGGLASLVLQRFVDMDLDEKLISPETLVRRSRA